MDKDGFTRINIVFPKNGIDALHLIDQVRGNQSRSSAIYNALAYLIRSGPDTLKGVIQSDPKSYDATPTQST